MSNKIENEIIDKYTYLPICLCVNTSESMLENNGLEKIEKLVKLIYNEFNDIYNNYDKFPLYDISIVTFGGDVKVMDKFGFINEKSFPSFIIKGNAKLAQGVQKSVDILMERKGYYRENNIDYFQPWLFLITNEKIDDIDELPVIQELTKSLVQEKKLQFVGLVIDNYSNKNEKYDSTQLLNAFSPRPCAVYNCEEYVKEFFSWSKPPRYTYVNNNKDGTVKLDIENIDDWGEI